MAAKTKGEAEFDQYEATGAIAQDTNGAGQEGTTPLLTLTRLVPKIHTIALDGAIYEVKTLRHYTLGRQMHFINARNQQLNLQAREEQGDELSEEESALQIFFLRKLCAAAIPGLSADDRASLDHLQLEAVAALFFDLSNSEETAVRTRVSQPTSDG